MGMEFSMHTSSKAPHKEMPTAQRTETSFQSHQVPAQTTKTYFQSHQVPAYKDSSQQCVGQITTHIEQGFEQRGWCGMDDQEYKATI